MLDIQIKYREFLLFWVIVLTLLTNAMAQDSSSVVSNDSSNINSDIRRNYNQIKPIRAISASAIAVGSLGFSWTQFEDVWGVSNGKFHFKPKDVNDDYLVQMDEISHFVASQRIVQLGRAIAYWVGFSDRTSTYMGVSASFVITLGVELIDAYNTEQGFGTTDLLIGFAGIAFDVLRHENEFFRRFDLRVSFKKAQDISNLLVIAHNYQEYDNTIFWLTFKPVKDLPFDIGIGYSSTRDWNTWWKYPEREVYLGVGISGSSLTDLSRNKVVSTIGSFFEWYEFMFSIKIYHGKPIYQDPLD